MSTARSLLSAELPFEFVDRTHGEDETAAGSRLGSRTRHCSRRRVTMATSVMVSPARFPFTVVNRVVNPALGSFLRTRVGAATLGSEFAIVEYEGRRSGRLRRLVTNYRRDGGAVTIPVGMAKRKAWWRNFASPAPVRLRLAGRDYEGVAHADTSERIRVLVDLDTAIDGDDAA
jgi:F420H(2)-dependent quinone reductase